MTREQELIVKYKDTQEFVTSLKAKLQDAQGELDKVSEEIRELMEAQDKKSTAKYEGLGYITLAVPYVRASYKKDNETVVFGYLEEVGRGDLVKQTVTSGALSSFVKGLLEEGKKVPEYISYYLQPNIRFYVK